MKKNIMKLAQDDIPIYAECGGLMYPDKINFRLRVAKIKNIKW